MSLIDLSYIPLFEFISMSVSKCVFRVSKVWLSNRRCLLSNSPLMLFPASMSKSFACTKAPVLFTSSRLVE